MYNNLFFDCDHMLSEVEINEFEKEFQFVMPDVIKKHYLSYNGYKLANWDNNYQRSVDEKQADRRVGKFVRLMKENHNEITVEQAKTKMIPHELPCDYDLMCKWYAMSYGYPA
jgi:hypothetical protein